MVFWPETKDKDEKINTLVGNYFPRGYLFYTQVVGEWRGPDFSLLEREVTDTKGWLEWTMWFQIRVGNIFSLVYMQIGRYWNVCRAMCILEFVYMYILNCPLRRPTGNDTPVTMSSLNTQILVLNTNLKQKILSFLEK